MKFRILAGKHSQKEPIYDGAGNPVVDAEGNPVLQPHLYSGPTPDKPQGDVVETDKDLVALFNQEPTHRKFERLDDDVRPSRGKPLNTPRLEAPPVPRLPRDVRQQQRPQPVLVQPEGVPPQRASMRTLAELEKMSTRELEAYAVEQGVELKGSKSKDDILKVFRGKAGA